MPLTQLSLNIEYGLIYFIGKELYFLKLVKSNIVSVFLVTVILLFIIFAFITDGPGAFNSFLSLQIHPGRLINDFIAVAGTGGAFLNSAAVGLVGLILIWATGITLSGPTFAAVLTMMGFALFGKTVFNIVPVIFGVYLSARYVGKGLRDYMIIALFGTAMGPLVSVLFLETGLPLLPGLGLSVLVGILAGFLMPAVAVSMLHMHQGYSLYNMGLSCGFLSLFAASILKSSGLPLESPVLWHSGNAALLRYLIPSLSLLAAGLGFFESGWKKGIKSFRKIQKRSGRLPSDFASMDGTGGMLINVGMVGLAGTLLVLLTSSDFSGPVIGGLLTVMGFAAFGTHLRNSWSVVAGVAAGALLFSLNLSDPGIILALIFCTTLAPLAGEFGYPAGFLAGFLHLSLVTQSGSWQGGINLYNNGFAGGLTATLIIAMIQWYRNNKRED